MNQVRQQLRPQVRPQAGLRIGDLAQTEFVVDEEVDIPIEVTGGVPPYEIDLEAPANLVLDGTSITGAVAAAGSAQITIGVTDAQGAVAQRIFTVHTEEA